jgi:hypothetical protein
MQLALGWVGMEWPWTLGGIFVISSCVLCWRQAIIRRLLSQSVPQPCGCKRPSV